MYRYLSPHYSTSYRYRFDLSPAKNKPTPSAFQQIPGKSRESNATLPRTGRNSIPIRKFDRSLLRNVRSRRNILREKRGEGIRTLSKEEEKNRRKTRSTETWSPLTPESESRVHFGGGRRGNIFGRIELTGKELLNNRAVEFLSPSLSTRFSRDFPRVGRISSGAARFI